MPRANGTMLAWPLRTWCAAGMDLKLPLSKEKGQGTVDYSGEKKSWVIQAVGNVESGCLKGSSWEQPASSQLRGWVWVNTALLLWVLPNASGAHPTPAPTEGNDTAAAAERVLPCFLSSCREVLTAVPRFLPPAILLSPCCPAFALGTRARRKESPDARVQKLPETKGPPLPLPQGLLAAAGCPFALALPCQRMQ